MWSVAVVRCFMELILTSSGSREILACMWSTCLTRIREAELSTWPGIHLTTYSDTFAMWTRTKDTNWPTGGFGLLLIFFPLFSYAVNLLEKNCIFTCKDAIGFRYTLNKYYPVVCPCSPLPDEMVQYARTDTHYLLYIYDCVRAQLLDSNHGQPGLLQSVWNKSKDISLTVCKI